MRTLRLFASVLRIELLGAVWFGGALTAWNAWEDGKTFSIVRALTLGAFYLVTMGLFLTACQLWAMRGTPRGQSITAWQESTVAVPSTPEPAGQIVRALQSLPAQVTEVDVPTGRYVARTGRPGTRRPRWSCSWTATRPHRSRT